MSSGGRTGRRGESEGGRKERKRGQERRGREGKEVQTDREGGREGKTAKKVSRWEE